MAGTAIPLGVGLIAVLIALAIGVPLGALAGYFRAEAPTFRVFGRRIRWPVDDGIMWLVNVVWSIPTLLLVIAITLALGKGFVQVFVAVGLTMWVEVARIVRGEVLRVRAMDFVEAARALGYTHGRILFRHVLPNTLGPVIVISAANFATAILMEAGLSFLGIGAQPPMVSWGAMIRAYYPYITTELWHLALLPGVCIMGLTLAFMLVGNALRDALDTRSIVGR
jgi:peptide/nickel transport system permease protein